jgi:hypothetical protein
MIEDNAWGMILEVVLRRIISAEMRTEKKLRTSKNTSKRDRRKRRRIGRRSRAG